MGMKGMVFTLDSIIALLLMASIISLFLFFRTESSSPFFTAQQLHSLSEDSLNILSQSTAREIVNQTLLNSLNQSGVLNESYWDWKVIDVLGMLWAENDTTSDSAAYDIANDVLGDMLPENIGYQILINDDDIYNSSDSSRPSNIDAEAGISSGRIASGYESNRSVSGCVALAYLASIKGKRDSSYVYFGGYIGDGNISANVTLPNFNSIKEAYMEMDVSNNFTFYINGQLSGYYTKGSGGGGTMKADKWYLSGTNLTLFHSGGNTIQLNFTSRSSIGGGYFRVTYNTTELATTEQVGYKKNYLPGIDGIINLYDSFYVPGNLSAMNISIYFKAIPSNQNISMYIGNTRIGSSNTSPFIISNATIISKLNENNLSYSNLSERTIPIRIGHYIINTTNQMGYVTDVILTTSRVSDMSSADIPNGTTNISRMSAAIELDKIFINNVLNNTGNRVGLVSYYSSIPVSCPGGICWTVNLLNNNLTLINNVSGYDAASGIAQRWLCGAILEAKTMLTDPLRKKYIVVMSDGSAEKSPGCINTNLCPQANYTPGNLTLDEQAAVNEAYDAYLRNITVYAIGFGQNANNNLLKQIAECGGGKWASSTNYSGLLDIYENFSYEIANESIIYAYQSVVSSSINSTIFSNSSIEINYTPRTIPEDYGKISLTMDGATLGNLTNNNSIIIPCKNGTYYFPTQVSVVDAKMTSYSSNYWTDRLSVQNITGGTWYNVFNLSYFGSNYLALGDPFIVNIPYANLPISGNNYSICIGTGFDVSNATGGSPDDRLIHTIRVKNSVSYGNLNATCTGARDDAVRRLNDTVGGFVDFGNDNIQIENSSISSVPYMWGPAIVKIKVWA